MVILELHCDINFYKKNTLTSIFNWLVAWKRGLPIKFYLKIYPHQPICNTPLWVFLWHKSHWGFWSLRVFIDKVVFRFHSDRASLGFSLIGPFLGSSLIWSSLNTQGKALLQVKQYSSLGSSELFFPPWC